MLSDRVSNPGPLDLEADALPTALRGLCTNILVRHLMFACTSSHKRASHTCKTSMGVLMRPDVDIYCIVHKVQ